MRKVTAIFAALALSATGALAADPAIGMWKSEPGETGGYIHVAITSCGDTLCGEIKDVVGNDNRTIIGRDIILDMQIKGNGKYAGGTIWAPDTDKTYSSKMTLKGDALVVKGCVAVFLCRGQNWTRLK
jgi:uncharacterized protein (DUF2147 family)